MTNPYLRIIAAANHTGTVQGPKLPAVSTPEGKSAVAYVMWSQMEGLKLERVAASMGVKPRVLKRFLAAAKRHYGAASKGPTP